ncbi:MAG: MFS transporter, partial [Gammaproteobacteria bacterium]|nr:MFS transporter [Gammaproteobacteria bacterium]
GVVPQRSRASAIAILLFVIALVGNGVGPQIVGVLSDSFMTLGLEQRGLAGILDVAACNPKVTSALPAAQQAACSAIYAEGLRNSMMVTALLLLVAATCFWMSSRHLDRDMLVR